jgi:hypothetical protein
MSIATIMSSLRDLRKWCNVVSYHNATANAVWIVAVHYKMEHIYPYSRVRGGITSENGIIPLSPKPHRGDIMVAEDINTTTLKVP